MIKKTLTNKMRKAKPTVRTLPKSNYEEGIWYTFNLNPNDDNQHWLSNSIHRDRLCVKSMQHLLQGLDSVAEYYLYPEWSKIGRFHGHGQIKFTDTYTFCMTYVRGLSNKAHLEIDYINDKKDREEYEKKDMNIMKTPFEFKNLPYPIVPVKEPEAKNHIMDAFKIYQKKNPLDSM